MNVPIRLAKKVATEQNQHVAFVFNGSRFVNYAANIKGKIHAEIRALTPLMVVGNKPYKNLTLMSLRLNKKGNLVNAKPCPKCTAYMVLAVKVRKVYYSTNGGTIERL